MSRRLPQLLRYAIAVAVGALAMHSLGGGLFKPPKASLPLSVASGSGSQSVFAPTYGSRPATKRPRPASPTARAPGRPATAPVSSAAVPISQPLEAATAPTAGSDTSGTSANSPRFVTVSDGTCSGCRVTQSANGAIHATIAGTSAGNDTAYALLDFGGPSGIDRTVFVQDRISLGAGQTPTSDLQVLQVLDSMNRVVYRLVISAGDHVLHVESPPGALSGDAIDLSTGVQVPNDGRSLLVSIGAGANSLVVVVNGKQIARLSGLRGGNVGPQRFLAAGVVAAAPSDAVALRSVSVTHADVSVGATAASAATSASSPPQLAATPPAPVITPSAVSPPELTGAAIAGGTLVATIGTWSDADAVLQISWERCALDGTACSPVEGAQGTTLTLGDADVGSALRVRVTASNSAGFGSAESALSEAVAAAPKPPPTVVATPEISGTTQVGSTLTGTAGTWNDATDFSYAWQRCDTTGGNCVPIEGATTSALVLSDGDAGWAIQLTVIATGPGGVAAATSAITAPTAPAAPPAPVAPSNVTAPSISGDVNPGGTLTASAGDWSDPNAQIGYSWQRCDSAGTCTAIEGATGTTYTVTDADSGYALQLVVTATNAGGSATATSAAVAIPAPAPPPAEPAPADAAPSS